MELFHHDVNFDWMGKAKYFFALSADVAPYRDRLMDPQGQSGLRD